MNPEPYRLGDGPDSATVTDDELAAGIRTAADDMSAALEVWRRSPDWSGGKYAIKTYEEAVRAGRAMAALPPDASWRELAAAMGPVLTAWFPSDGAAAPLAEAVERLRWAAINLPSLVEQRRDPFGSFRRGG